MLWNPLNRTLATGVVLAALPCVSASAAVTTIDDFESGSNGDDLGTLAGWTVGETGDYTVVNEPAGGSNLVLQAAEDSDPPNAYKSLGVSIPTTSTAATLFYRIRFEDGSTGDRVFAGFSADSAPDSFGDMAAYAGGITGGGGFGARDFDSTVSAGSPAADTWYNVWIVANNSTQKYDVYINTGTADATAGDKLFSDFDFREDATGLPGALTTLGLLMTGSSSGTAYLDDFKIDDSAQNLQYQLVPEPASLALLGLGGLLLLSPRRAS